MENNNSNEPIVLGTLRKEKSSKPTFVFLVLVIILGITFSLPYLEGYVKDPNTILGKVYYSLFGPSEPDTGGELVVPEDSAHILNDKTYINFKNIILTNVTLNDKTIVYNIKSTLPTFNLDGENYYLEIYGSANNLLERIKLTGTLTPTVQEKSFTFKDLKFNPNNNYYSKVKELKDEDYEEIILSSDESGIASLICIDQNNKFEYIFDNYKLKDIKHTFEYTDTSNIDLYLKEYQNYNNKSGIINKLKASSSKTEETNNGFVFSANLDLNVISKEKLESADNLHYYNLDKLAKIVYYDMKVQGYTCE